MLDQSMVEQMSQSERLEAMELLWKSLSKYPDQVPSPDWHGPILQERLADIQSGKAAFLTLEEAKNRLGAELK